MRRPYKLEIPALEIRQGQGRLLYSFAIDGKLIPKFASISRLKREEDGTLLGYQRPEVLSHIDEIRQFLESPRPMIPNAIVLAFNNTVTFRPQKTSYHKLGHSRTGILTIPVDETLPNSQRPAFVVDGQQRLAAVREANINFFPLCVTAFITKEASEQTDQFILVNSTKPLSKGLIYELLPNTEARLPLALDKKRVPAELLIILNSRQGSPFEGLIQTPTNPSGIIKDNSILRMIEHSLNEGVLYKYRDKKESKAQEEMVSVLYAYWSAVKEVFPTAWGKSSKESRLMHGAGIISMGLLMDTIADLQKGAPLTQEMFAAELKPLSKACHWIGGEWDFGQGVRRQWNDLQNTSVDIDLLEDYLVACYKKLKTKPTRRNYR